MQTALHNANIWSVENQPDCGAFTLNTNISRNDAMNSTRATILHDSVTYKSAGAVKLVRAASQMTRMIKQLANYLPD
jgi:hypothetical protein